MNLKKIRRKKRTGGKIKGTSNRPRLSVFRSNKYISAQLIDDEKAETLVSVSEKKLKEKLTGKSERARALGKLLSEKAKEKKITNIVFDKGPYAYHGRVRKVAEGAREGGLKF